MLGLNIDFLDFVGLVGAGLILLGFYRISIGRWTNKSMLYELDNLVGAACLIVYQSHHEAYISATLNVVWAVIAFTGLSSLAQRRAIKVKSKPSRRRRA